MLDKDFVMAQLGPNGVMPTLGLWPKWVLEGPWPMYGRCIQGIND